MVVMATKPLPAVTQPAQTQPSSVAPAPTQGPPQQQDNSGVAPVSPDNVGRLFVQQYYTVLNKAPHLLHRFYTKGSSFVHGKVDQDGNAEEPVYGQKEIYHKIMALDFCDCYAKIRQVDSYATLGEGVVVQVTGELSTHRKPMRRFTQTFVLAPHSARNYYVRNDIFRYHDEVFQEVEGEELEVEEDRVESDEETVDSPTDKPDSEDCEGEEEDHDGLSNIPAGGAPLSSALLHQGHVPPIQQPQNVPLPSQQTAAVPQTGPMPSHTPPILSQEPQPSAYYSPPQSTVSNGLEQSPGGTPPKALHHQVDNQLEEEMDNEPPTGPPLQDIATPPVGPSPPPEEVLQDDKPPAVKEPPPAVQENKIFSWADRVQGGQKSTPAQPPMQTVQTAPPQPKPPIDSFGGPPRGGLEALPQRESRKPRGGGGGGWPRRGPDVGEGDRIPRGPPSRIFSDKQQLFVGNLPQDIKDDELKDFFSKYGKVVEMRINRNSNPKLPFFGFIVFDEPGPVQEILEQRRKQPILFRDGYRLNVEEKKPKGTDARPRMNRPNSGPPPRGGHTGRGRAGGPGMGGPSRMGRGFGPQR